jgi:hypothetical protein
LGEAPLNYRSPLLLSFAREAPYCFHCGAFNRGNVVAAHSNQIRDGKGKSIKAHDYRIAYLCDTCHFEIDQGSKLSRAERRESWDAAHRATIGWLIDTGRLRPVRA